MSNRLRNFSLLALLLTGMAYLLFSNSTLLAGLRQAAPLHPALEPVDCWFPETDHWPRVECFYLSVPENHQQPDGTRIKLAVVRIRPFIAFGRPVLHLGGGGPGNAMGFGWPDQLRLLVANYRQLSLDRHRPLYIIDPRGVGESRPNLMCEEIVAESEQTWQQRMTRAEENQSYLEALRACRTRLTASGIDLSQYHSLNVARDVEYLRLALGIDQWDLYGVSYATRYAITLAREYPDSVAAMVLDGAVFPGARSIDNLARSMAKAFKRAFDHCTNDSLCRSDFPNLEQRTWQLIERLNAAPIEVGIEHPYRKSGHLGIVVNGDRLVSVIFMALYSDSFFDTFPGMIHELESGKTELLADTLSDFMAFQLDPGYGDGSQLSHFCTEEHPFVDYALAVKNAAVYLPQLEYSADEVLTLQASCELWDVPPAATVEARTPVIDTPTLFLHGELDPVLPVEDMYDELQYFSRYDLWIYPDIAHDIVSASADAEHLAGEFFDKHLEYDRGNRRSETVTDAP